MTREFDEYAHDYRSVHTQNVAKVSGKDSDYFTEYKIQEIYRRKWVRPGASILDFGCGDGNSARFFRKYDPSCRYFGVDVSEESIETAKAKYQTEGVSFCAYDGRRLPYKSGVFDVVFIACVLHHVEPEDRPGLLREIRRVLKPGGRLIIFEHNPYNPLTRRMVNTCPFDVNAKLLTSGYQMKLLDHTGFVRNRKLFTIFMPRKGFFEKLVGLEYYLAWLPVGGQYYTVSEKRR